MQSCKKQCKKIWLFVQACVVLLMAACSGGGTFVREDCTTQNLNPVQLQQKAKVNVVHLIADGASGTGWILSGGGSDETLIVTNYHVIGDANQIDAEWPIQGTAGIVKISGLQVLKVDPVRDLALLRAPRTTDAPGLSLNLAQCTAAQDILILGYPGVASSNYELTVESGSITATNRVVDRQTYIQTNANINPGNSGGPALDSCGHVVGVVVARVTSTERTNLIIPAEGVQDLYNRHTALRKPVTEEINAKLNQFFQALIYNESDTAAGYMSRKYLRETVAPVFATELQVAAQYIAEYENLAYMRGINIDRSEDFIAFMQSSLAPEHYQTMIIALMMDGGTATKYQGLQSFFALFTKELFGTVESYQVDDIAPNGTESAEIKIRVKAKEGTDLWKFSLRYEWGDWMIDQIVLVERF